MCAIMKSFVVIFVSICCSFVAIQSAAVDPVVTELQQDDAQNPVTVSELATNEDCIQPKETGRCFALFYRYAYDVEKRDCVEFIYGGCSGNSNNFETKEDCEQKCSKNKPNSLESDDDLHTTATPNREDEAVTEKV